MANPIVEAMTPFVWGAGGAKKTPEEIAREKEIAAEILMKAGNTSPVGHWTQGAARVVDALGGVIKQRRADAAGVDNAKYNESLLSGLLGGGSSAQSPVPMTEAAGEVAATSPGQPVDMTGNDVFTGFMDTVKAGGVTNPYALAAIAATGKRESGFSPGNVNRTWSDPSESGQAGTAGGIMSWRGPRYQALAATGDLSPQGQAKFFLQEDPQLIARLNSAKSAEEAQQMMNEAWKFAGWDRPGGEAAARIATANAFLPTFQQAIEAGATPAQAEQIATAEVASLDPASGMATPEAAIEAVAPVDVQPSLTDEVAAFQQTPEYAAQFPGQTDEFAGSQQVQNGLAAQSGIVQALTGGTPADPAQIEQARSQPVQQVAQAMAEQPQQAQGMDQAALLRALSDPRATPQTRAVVQALMQQQFAQQQAEREMQMKQADPAYQIGLEKSRLEVENLRNPRLTPADQLAREKFDLERGQQGKTADINEYEYAKERGYEGSFVDFQLAQKKAGAASTTINTGEGDKFYENLDKKNAETFSALSETGMQGRSKLAQIDRLEGLLANAPQGAGAMLKQAAGEYGINTEGLSDLQAAQALINELVPQQRQPGSGPMSDADLALFKQSLPRLINQPEGNKAILDTMRGITQYQIQMGEIADSVANREISPAEGRKMIRSLENPLDGFSKMVRQQEMDDQDDGWQEMMPGVRVRKIQ